MKKFMLIALALILALTACTPSEVPNGDDASPSPDTTPPVLVLDADGDSIALRVGNVEITSNEYRYHYYSAAQTIISFYGSFMDIDPNKPFDEQYLDEDESYTWAEFFAEQAVSGVRNSVILSEQAKKMGMTLDESFAKQVAESIQNIKDHSAANNMPLEQMLNEYYGGNLDEQKLRAIMERTYLGYQFEMHKRASVDVSESVLLDFYNENSDYYDVVDYLNYMFDTEEDAAACLEAVTDRQSFYDYIAENYDESMDDNLIIGDDNTGDEFSDWLFDAGRVEGDVEIIEAYDMFFVVYFIRRYQPNDEIFSIRHILISSENIPAEEARAKAEELYEEWKNGAATEESFAMLARAHSQDPGSASNGGLYENVLEGQMVEPFDSWCFDPARKQGDTGLVDTDYGTHIMYYTGYVLSWKGRVKQSIIEEAYSEFYDGLLDQYQVESLNTNVAR